MRSLLVLCLFFSALTLSAQSVGWTQPLLSDARDGIWDVIADADGNTYVTGFFEGDMDIDGTILLHVGGQDFFLAKFNPTGSLLWVETFTGSGFDRGDVLTLDAAGNVILGGLFSETLDVLGTSVTSVGSSDILLMSLTPEGDLNWVNTFGGTGSDICYGVDAANGTLYVTGHFSATVDFGGFSETSFGGSDAFVLSMDANNGTVNWAETFGSSENDRLYQVAATNDGGVVAVGYFEDSFDLDGQTFTSQAVRDQIIIKLDSNNALQWGRVGMSPGQFDTAQDVVTDEQGNLYISGTFSDSLVVAGQTLYGSSEGQYNSCMYALGNNGNYGWGFACNTPEGSFGGNISRDANYLYQGFTMSNGILYDGSSVSGLEMNSAALAVFTPNGEFVDAVYFDGPDNDYFGASAPVNGDLVIGLGFVQSIDLPGETVAGAADQDVVLFRMDPELMTNTEEPTPQTFDEVAETRWNPVDQSLEIDIFDDRIDWIAVYSTDGRLLVQQPATAYNRVPLPNVSGGTVVVQLTGGGQVYAQLVPVGF